MYSLIFPLENETKARIALNSIKKKTVNIFKTSYLINKIYESTNLFQLLFPYFKHTMIISNFETLDRVRKIKRDLFQRYLFSSSSFFLPV